MTTAQNAKETIPKDVKIEWNDSAFVKIYEHFTDPNMEKIRQPSTSSTEKNSADVEEANDKKEKEWKEGDLCMAPYSEDGRWYPAKILNINGNMCRVSYTEYGEEEDVKVSELLSESDVENPEEETMDCGTILYESAQNDIPLKSAKDDVPLIPKLCPPPPALFAKLAKSHDEKESLTNMLMAWYMSGYHTGYYEGLKEGQKSTSTQNKPQGSKQ